MSQVLTICEPAFLPRVSRSSKSHSTRRALRQEVDNMLRDVAFVLAQTRRIREAIDDEHSEKPAVFA